MNPFVISGVVAAAYVTGYFIGQWQERKFIRKFGLPEPRWVDDEQWHRNPDRRDPEWLEGVDMDQRPTQLRN